jgi:cystathionine beta-lyase/cystathionine gamma-synthase
MRQHEQNAFRVAEYLKTDALVEEVFYPAFATYKGHEIAKKQMSGYGGVVSFRIKGGLDEANSFFKKLIVSQLADSLGGIESLANYSALMTHEAFPPKMRQQMGITENLKRLSVGIEHIDDLIDDLKEALKS